MFENIGKIFEPKKGSLVKPKQKYEVIFWGSNSNVVLGAKAPWNGGNSGMHWFEKDEIEWVD